MSESPTTAAEHQARIAAEYGTYVALQAIDINGGRAFNTGDPVPVSHVESGVVSKDVVARKDTKAAKAATEES